MDRLVVLRSEVDFDQMIFSVIVQKLSKQDPATLMRVRSSQAAAK